MSVRSGFGRVVRPRNIDNNWNYSDSTSTTTVPPARQVPTTTVAAPQYNTQMPANPTLLPPASRGYNAQMPVNPATITPPTPSTASQGYNTFNYVPPVTSVQPPRRTSDAAGLGAIFAAPVDRSVPSGYGGNWTGTRGLSEEQIADAALRQAVLAEQGQETDMVFADWLAGNLLGTIMPDETPTVPTGVGGGGSSTTAADLAALQQFINDSIASVQQTYGGYRESAQSAYEKALERVNAANAAAAASVGSLAPMAQFDYRFQPTVQPMAGGMDYLRAIGAPTAQVDATRQLGQQLMANQMQSAQDFANASAAAAAQERLARQAAVQTAGLQGVSGLESTAAALQAQIAAAQAAEERALQQSLLQNRLKYGVA